MKSFILSIGILILVVFNGFGQASTKGFKSLEKGEYDKAIEVFSKHIKEDPSSSAANLGLAMVYSTDVFVNHDFFKAWDYVVIANDNFSKLTPEENEFLKNY